MPTARLSVVGHHCSRLPALAPPGSPLVAHLLRRRAPPSSISSSCATCRVPHCIVQLLATGHDPPHPHARATRLWSGLPGVHNVHTPSSAIPSFWSALRHCTRAVHHWLNLDEVQSVTPGSGRGCRTYAGSTMAPAGTSAPYLALAALHMGNVQQPVRPLDVRHGARVPSLPPLTIFSVLQP
jgi:hypothetical protein